MIDRSVIEKSIQKEEKACKSLYEESIAYVFSIVRRYIWNEDSRKDVVQEIYARVFKNLIQFDEGRGSFNNWIRRIAINQCLMHIRKAERNASIVPITVKDEGIKYEELNLNELSRADIDKILNHMPSGYRTIFLLIVLDDYSHEEVSELLNISKETSRSQLSRAKKWMRKYFFSEHNIRVDGLF